MHAIFHNIQYIHWKYTNTFTWPTHKDLFNADQPNILRENVKRYPYIGNDANMFHIWSQTFNLIDILKVQQPQWLMHLKKIICTIFCCSGMCSKINILMSLRNKHMILSKRFKHISYPLICYFFAWRLIVALMICRVNKLAVMSKYISFMIVQRREFWTWAHLLLIFDWPFTLTMASKSILTHKSHLNMYKWLSIVLQNIKQSNAILFRAIVWPH